MYKTLIQTLLACFYAILAASPLEGGGVMIAARQIAFGGSAKGLSAKDIPVMPDVAYWDGIENAGWGVHDPNATVWKDLIGNGYDLSLMYGAHFDINSLVTAERNRVSALLGSSLPYRTIEVCGFRDQSRNSSSVVCFGNSSNNKIMLACAENSIQIYNPNQLMLDEAVSPYNTWAGVHDDGQHIPYVAGAVAKGTYRNNNWSVCDGTFGLSGSSNYAAYNFVGNYYCVRLHSRALSAEEIADNYEFDKARFNLP